ncbi:hypothetical protein YASMINEVIRUS_1395 [Yasminevirus sp. GU-2018]|uniref:Uncharacterized protein n=1 Tax=Yasminevirus sp. GU-2018 TaxID=2420051 RepID=A0A5K0UBB3_9VIRU|nr:hypothetical protein YASMINEVIRUS_1395 [Yasminevirus sp. GU-2018]
MSGDTDTVLTKVDDVNTDRIDSQIDKFLNYYKGVKTFVPVLKKDEPSPTESNDSSVNESIVVNKSIVDKSLLDTNTSVTRVGLNNTYALNKIKLSSDLITSLNTNPSVPNMTDMERLRAVTSRESVLCRDLVQKLDNNYLGYDNEQLRSDYDSAMTLIRYCAITLPTNAFKNLLGVEGSVNNIDYSINMNTDTIDSSALGVVSERGDYVDTTPITTFLKESVTNTNQQYFVPRNTEGDFNPYVYLTREWLDQRSREQKNHSGLVEIMDYTETVRRRSTFYKTDARHIVDSLHKKYSTTAQNGSIFDNFMNLTITTVRKINSDIIALITTLKTVNDTIFPEYPYDPTKRQSDEKTHTTVHTVVLEMCLNRLTSVYRDTLCLLTDTDGMLEPGDDIIDDTPRQYIVSIVDTLNEVLKHINEEESQLKMLSQLNIVRELLDYYEAVISVSVGDRLCSIVDEIVKKRVMSDDILDSHNDNGDQNSRQTEFLSNLIEDVAMRRKTDESVKVFLMTSNGRNLKAELVLEDCMVEGYVDAIESSLYTTKKTTASTNKNTVILTVPELMSESWTNTLPDLLPFISLERDGLQRKIPLRKFTMCLHDKDIEYLKNPNIDLVCDQVGVSNMLSFYGATMKITKDETNKPFRTVYLLARETVKDEQMNSSFIQHKMFALLSSATENQAGVVDGHICTRLMDEMSSTFTCMTHVVKSLKESALIDVEKHSVSRKDKTKKEGIRSDVILKYKLSKDVVRKIVEDILERDPKTDNFVSAFNLICEEEDYVKRALTQSVYETYTPIKSTIDMNIVDDYKVVNLYVNNNTKRDLDTKTTKEDISPTMFVLHIKDGYYLAEEMVDTNLVSRPFDARYFSDMVVESFNSAVITGSYELVENPKNKVENVLTINIDSSSLKVVTDSSSILNDNVQQSSTRPYVFVCVYTTRSGRIKTFDEQNSHGFFYVNGTESTDSIKLKLTGIVPRKSVVEWGEIDGTGKYQNSYVNPSISAYIVKSGVVKCDTDTSLLNLRTHVALRGYDRLKREVRTRNFGKRFGDYFRYVYNESAITIVDYIESITKEKISEKSRVFAGYFDQTGQPVFRDSMMYKIDNLIKSRYDAITQLTVKPSVLPSLRNIKTKLLEVLNTASIPLVYARFYLMYALKVLLTPFVIVTSPIYILCRDSYVQMSRTNGKSMIDIVETMFSKLLLTMYLLVSTPVSVSYGVVRGGTMMSKYVMNDAYAKICSFLLSRYAKIYINTNNDVYNGSEPYVYLSCNLLTTDALDSNIPFSKRMLPRRDTTSNGVVYVQHLVSLIVNNEFSKHIRLMCDVLCKDVDNTFKEAVLRKEYIDIMSVETLEVYRSYDASLRAFVNDVITKSGANNTAVSVSDTTDVDVETGIGNQTCVSMLETYFNSKKPSDVLKLVYNVTTTYHGSESMFNRCKIMCRRLVLPTEDSVVSLLRNCEMYIDALTGLGGGGNVVRFITDNLGGTTTKQTILKILKFVNKFVENYDTVITDGEIDSLMATDLEDVLNPKPNTFVESITTTSNTTSTTTLPTLTIASVVANRENAEDLLILGRYGILQKIIDEVETLEGDDLKYCISSYNTLSEMLITRVVSDESLNIYNSFVDDVLLSNKTADILNVPKRLLSDNSKVCTYILSKTDDVEKKKMGFVIGMLLNVSDYVELEINVDLPNDINTSGVISTGVTTTSTVLTYKIPYILVSYDVFIRMKSKLNNVSGDIDLLKKMTHYTN